MALMDSFVGEPSRKGIITPVPYQESHVYEEPIEERFFEMGNEAYLCMYPLELGDGAFTNVYDFSYDPSFATTVLHSAQTPYYLRRQLMNDTRILAGINGGFYFSANEASSTPSELVFNLCIRNGKIVSLPVIDMPVAMMTEEGELHVENLGAFGMMQIGDHEITWAGKYSPFSDVSDAAVYTPACATIHYISSPHEEIAFRKLDDTPSFISTPKDKDSVDIALKMNEDGKLVVAYIQQGGGSNIVTSPCVLHLHQGTTDYHVGDHVEIVHIGNLPIDAHAITSAISIGPEVSWFASNIGHPFDQLPSLCNQPFQNRRHARSVLLKDSTGRMHLQVFDGKTNSPSFSGITPYEVYQHLSSKQLQWAYFLDGGKSARLAVRSEKELPVLTLGNNYLKRFFQNPSFPPLWNGYNGRKIPSSILIKSR